MICVSVVLPTYRRPALLERCLGALASQNFNPAWFEIIVVDDADDGDTRRRVQQWARFRPLPAVRYVPVRGPHGPAIARNVGWRTAEGELIAFTDDDTIPEPEWLRHGWEAFQRNPRLVAAWGRIVVPLPPKPTDYEKDAAGLEGAEFATANAFCRRGALEAVGGFDERFRLAWREDSDLYFSLLEMFGDTPGPPAIAPVPEACVMHPVRPASWGESLRQARKAMYNALLYKKHPRLYREKIQRFPPWLYYLDVALLIAAGINVFRGDAQAVTFCLSAWIALTVLFSIKRLYHTAHAPLHIAEMLVTSALIPVMAVYWRLRGALRFRVAFL
jgi:glycosyltransferase involved in cell wall biosynthesis